MRHSVRVDTVVFILIITFVVLMVEIIPKALSDEKPKPHPCPECECGCWEGGCVSTLVFCGNPWVDKYGVWHYPEDCNTTTCQYECRPCDENKTQGM